MINDVQLCSHGADCQDQVSFLEGLPKMELYFSGVRRHVLLCLNPCLSDRSFSSCPAAATCECRGSHAGWAGEGHPSLGSSTGTGRAGNAAVAPGARRARERGYCGSSSRPRPPKLSSWGAAEAVRSSGLEVRERVARWRPDGAGRPGCAHGVREGRRARG